MTARMTSAPLSFVGQLAHGGRRMCGEGRVAGSIYLECGVCVGGTPIEQFLKDPPARLLPHQFNLKTRGVNVITTPDGVSHILDWIGSEHYEYPVDFIEEARVMGISRRISKTADMSRLGPGSMLIMAHAKGTMVNMEEVLAGSQVVCPNLIHRPGERCAGVHWTAPGVNGRRSRVDGSTYAVTALHPDAPEPQYIPAIIMAAPISAITVIRSHDGSVDQSAWNAAARSGFTPVAAHT